MGKRPPYTRAWGATKILEPGALSGLNPEARAIVLGMINSGPRPSELAELHVEEMS